MKNPITLTNLNKISGKNKRRVGRGHGSGKVKTAGRGTKGQRARGRMPLWFEGGQLPLMKRVPFIRGKSKNKSIKSKPVILTLSDLDIFAKDAKVTTDSLKKSGLIKKDVNRIKILGRGEVKNSLQVYVECSEKAVLKIEKKGGKVVKST